MSKPNLPQGTRDFSAAVVRKRNYIFETIRSVFEVYGFQPLETPAMENLDTLMGKYGEEGDKLIFKILNNGLDNADKHNQAKEDFEKILSGKNTKGITERALRYDLTIPFARYVAMNYGQLTLPFKRYQIQPVWRADRPQKGRYREFYQCDADVVGSRSLLNEVELAGIYSRVFQQLKVPVEVHINSRKILAALAELCGGADKMIDITIAIDKLDKIGLEKVKAELSLKGLTESQVNTIEKYLSIEGTDEEKLTALKTLIGDNKTGLQGIEEIEYILNYQPQTSNLPAGQAGSRLQTDFTLARGLNYYTGIIFEVKAIGVQMEELKLFPEEVQAGTQVLFFNLGEAESKTAFGLMQQLRNKGIACELFHEHTKFDKQFKYADKKQIPYVVILGSEELAAGTCVVKDLRKSEQVTVSQSALQNFIF